MEVLIRRIAPGWRATRFAGVLGTMLLVLVIVSLGLGSSPAQARFNLGLQDDGFGPGASAAQTASAYGAMSTIHGSYVRIPLEWTQVVGSTSAFDQANPADTHYGWEKVDPAVRSAAEHHLKMILVIDRAPSWAQGPGPVKPYVSDGAWNPDPGAFSRFVHAAALRYSGHFPDPARPDKNLPRVKYWEAWNEANIPGFFSAPDPLGAYRNLLDIADRQLKAVHRSNVVVLGGLAPVSPVPGSIPPLRFAAGLMCLRPAGSRFVRIRSCRRAHFDAIAVHAYSIAATPTKHAYTRGDLLIGDIGRVRALLRAARAHYPLWVTEFSWYTNPPNQQIGDAPQTAARYVDYSLYEMWRAGVGVIIWFKVLEVSTNDTYPGGGLYSAPGQPKLTLSALAFPFVAGAGRSGGFAWGRVPMSQRRRVVVERAAGHRWVRVAAARTGSDGVFDVRFRARRNGLYRARVSRGPTSLPYDSRPIPPRRTHAYQIF